MMVHTRSQYDIHTACLKSRKLMQFTREHPTIDKVFYARWKYVKEMMEDNSQAKTSDRYKIIFKLFDYLVEIREELHQFGPEFTKIIIQKLNEFISLYKTDHNFSERMYEYKTILLPYIR